MNKDSDNGLIAIFCRHPVAANLLMVMMIISGFWALQKLNSQFLPSFDLEYASISVVWPGASSEDTEELITTKLEQELRDIDYVKEMTSTSSEGVSAITIEFSEGVDMDLAMNQVRQRVDGASGLPSDAETPRIQQIIRYERIASVLLVADVSDAAQLRNMANQFERELLNRGIAKVDITGLPEEEIVIEISPQAVAQLGLSFEEIAQRISVNSQNAPLGTIGRDNSARQLRFTQRANDVQEFNNLRIIDKNGQSVLLGQIAQIEKRPKASQVELSYQGKPAVALTMRRTENADSLTAARIFTQWLQETKPTLPESSSLLPFSQDFELLEGRINLLLENGLGGLILVVAILFLFLNGRVAFWVAVGIPVCFMFALSFLYLFGASINMLSLFGLIMALGIIVDDAIVVGEEATAQFESGHERHNAAYNAAKRMLGPVFSSSLTTIAAFMPLFLVGGIIGTVMREIPLVVVCVILASLVECFLVLPGHLSHSFKKMQNHDPSPLRQRLDGYFNHFRDGFFRVHLQHALRYPTIIFATTIAVLVVTAAWLSSGRLGFQFFPTAEPNELYLNANFVSGTPAHVVDDYLEYAQQTFRELEAESGEKISKVVYLNHGQTSGERPVRGDNFGSIAIELVEPDKRNTRNSDIIKRWREMLPRPAGLENLIFYEPRGGPPGSDIDIRISNVDSKTAKEIAVKLQTLLRGIEGVSGITDDLPYGREQMILTLTPAAQQLGVSIGTISSQIRSAYEGVTLQTNSDGFSDVDVVVKMPRDLASDYSALNALPLILPSGQIERLGNLVDIDYDRGFDSIRHADGLLAVSVTGSVDPALANANDIRADLESSVLPKLSAEHGAQFSFGGRQEDQAETLGDMRIGAVISVVLIYLVLAWVFASYAWPLLVMAIIPFGLVGAIWGHVLMGIDLTILSLFGFFGLAGIVVNDSIILVVFYKQLRAKGMAVYEAVVEAACQRLRAVILTSLTTIAGLTPLLFETSLQAQFLIPMATSLAFGIGFSTLLIMFLLPSLLLVYEKLYQRIRKTSFIAAS